MFKIVLLFVFLKMNLLLPVRETLNQSWSNAFTCPKVKQFTVTGASLGLSEYGKWLLFQFQLGKPQRRWQCIA